VSTTAQGANAASTSGGGTGGRSGAVEADAFTRELEALSTSQLEELLKDEEAFRKFAIHSISNTPAARALAEVRAQNVALARDNLAMQGTIEEARNHVAIVKSSEYAGAKAAFEELVARQAAVLAAAAPNVLLGALVADTDKLDDASSALQDQYQSGAMSLDAFVDAYTASRVAFHILDLKRQTSEQSMY